MLCFTILGQPYSKANRRRLGRINGHSAIVKSREAVAYERDVMWQIPAEARMRLARKIKITMRLYYRTELPDLDESLILDCLQDRYAGSGKTRTLVASGVYRNDRQVREKHIYHGIDAKNPRAEITVEEL